jgi:hypothetical protein
MSDRTPPRASVAPDPVTGSPAASGWASWVVFAGVLLILVGAVHVLEGVLALAGAEADGPVLLSDPVARGVLHCLFGLLTGLTGLGLLAGIPAARVAAVLFAALSALGAATSTSAAAAAVLISLDVVVIYAVTTRGGDLRSPAY